jgi:hypothetical protein
MQANTAVHVRPAALAEQNMNKHPNICSCIVQVLEHPRGHRTQPFDAPTLAAGVLVSAFLTHRLLLVVRSTLL